MFADDMRRAVEAAPRMKLAELSGVLWKAYGAGAIGDDECQALAELIEARKIVPTPQVGAVPAPRRAGSRPKTEASLIRRRRWVASGWLPPQVACGFTVGEAAVLSVVAAEVARHAQCTLPVEAIAALAGVSRSQVQKTLKRARIAGLLVVIARPEQPFRHRPNIVRITSREWSAWISMRRSSPGSKAKPQGSKPVDPTKVHAYSAMEGKVRGSKLVGTGSERKFPRRDRYDLQKWPLAAISGSEARN